MKFALVDGQRQEAKRNLSGYCPACGSAMVPRCGDVRVNHWAHRGRRECDPWWESETEWHRAWKGKFPKDWQERIHQAESGEKHIADVKTDQGWVLEFQHSYMDPDERRAREHFYQKLVWIVDGARRQRDTQQFFKALHDGELVDVDNGIRRVPLSNRCALLRDWAGSRAAILFDFCEHREPDETHLALFGSSGGSNSEDTHLWWLVQVIDEKAYLLPFGRAEFVVYHSPDAARKDPVFGDLLSKYRAFAGYIARPHEHRPPNQFEAALHLREQLFGKLRSTRRTPL